MKRNILLIEPNYKNKFPPIGLMKLATYFRLRGDNVVFYKGDLKEFLIDDITGDCVEKLNQMDSTINWKLRSDKIATYIKYRRKADIAKIGLEDSAYAILLAPWVEYYKDYYHKKEYLKHPKWDWIGVTTLFTFYWDITIETINFAKLLVKKKSDLMVGGVLASIQPNEIYQLLVPYADEFCKELEDTGLIDGMLKDDKNRFFSLVGERTRKEHFGETYSVNYKGSFASLAQAQRHRTLSYEINPQIEKEYYIPKIIEKNKDLKLQWQEDMEKIIDNHPQAQLLTINERGTVENLILKAKERLCTCAQLEISNQTKNTLTRYVNECEEPEIIDYLKPYTKGARCTFPDYKCPNSCNYKEGVTLEREI